MYELNRGDKKSPPKKKFDFNTYKNNTTKSLNDVEFFLNNFQRFTKYVKLFKFFR